MTSKISQPWLSPDRIEELVQIEPALLILGLTLGAWIASRIFFPKLSLDRRRNLKGLMGNLGYHLVFGTSLFIIYTGLLKLPEPSKAIERLVTYIGLTTLLSGAVIFVKVSRVLVFQYLFLSHRKVAFPVLLVNLFTLLLSLILATWLGSELFNIRLTPILATSAIFSLVLGLALQDTLGNLFAGVTLQFDKPYEIGDWIEIQTGTQKWVGQVYEISWRATLLVASTEESITIPNRVMAQAQISNYSTKFRPIVRGVVFRLPFGVDIQQVKEILVQVPATIPSIRSIPAPRVFVTETSESWIGFKLFFNIDDFGKQFYVIDQVYSEGIKALHSKGFELASHRVSIFQETQSPTS